MAATDGGSTELVVPGDSKKLDSKEDVAHIVKSIEGCTEMVMLKLSGNSYGLEAMKAIGESLSNKGQLSRALWSDMFVSRLKTELPPALTSLAEGVMTAQACLTELDLSDNAFGPVGVEALVGFLTSPSCFTLKVARFNNNGLGIKGGTVLSDALLACNEEARKAGQKLSLEVFVAGRNRLEDDGAKALSRVFEALGTLVEVSLPQNGINKDGVSALAKAFKKNQNLEVIDLNDNTVTEEGSLALADALPSLQQLRVLNLGDCLVRNDGARAIAGAIKDSHHHLKEISLSYCELEKEAALVVADSLANKEELTSIDLNGNDFGADGIELLRESLEAKKLLDALGSLSEDEGLDEEDSDEEEEGGASDEEGGASDREGGASDKEDVVTNEEGMANNEEAVVNNKEGEASEKEAVVNDEEGVSNGKEPVANGKEGVNSDPVTAKEPPTQESTEEDEPPPKHKPISVDEFMTAPDAHNLVALGDDRVQLINDSLARGSPNSPPQLFDIAGMYVKVSCCYGEQCDGSVKKIVEQCVDELLRPVFEENRGNILLNEVLVHIGLIKGEDKKFKPVTEVEGPLLALVHVARQSYFPRASADLLIAFLTKPSSVVNKLMANGVAPKILQALHTL